MNKRPNLSESLHFVSTLSSSNEDCAEIYELYNNMKQHDEFTAARLLIEFTTTVYASCNVQSKADVDSIIFKMAFK